MWAAGLGSLGFLGKFELGIPGYWEWLSQGTGVGLHCQPQDRRQILGSSSGSGCVLILHSDISSLSVRFKGPSGATYVLSRAASILPDFGTCNGYPRVPVTMEVKFQIMANVGPPP